MASAEHGICRNSILSLRLPVNWFSNCTSLRLARGLREEFADLAITINRGRNEQGGFFGADAIREYEAEPGRCTRKLEDVLRHRPSAGHSGRNDPLPDLRSTIPPIDQHAPPRTWHP